MWREFAAEVTALGLKAFEHGPEIHLALPVLYLALAMFILFWRKK